MTSDHPFIMQLSNLQHKCVKPSKLKMSQTNIVNESVWLKNIRLSTKALVAAFLKVLFVIILDCNNTNMHLHSYYRNSIAN